MNDITTIHKFPFKIYDEIDCYRFIFRITTDYIWESHTTRNVWRINNGAWVRQYGVKDKLLGKVNTIDEAKELVYKDFLEISKMKTVNNHGDL